VSELILLEGAETSPGLQHHVARALLELAAQDLHQRGFAAAVGADQAVAVAVGEFGRDLLEERLGPELHGDVERCEHIYPFEWRIPGRPYLEGKPLLQGASR